MALDLEFSDFQLATSAFANEIDNGVVGQPEIECGPDSILVNVNTKNTFEGHIYVKGFYSTPGCRTEATNNRAASISVPFSNCGVRRERSVRTIWKLCIDRKFDVCIDEFNLKTALISKAHKFNHTEDFSLCLFSKSKYS